ncbi:hypothetical protein [Bacteroides xylanisolvens]
MQHTKGDLIARGNPMVYCIYFFVYRMVYSIKNWRMGQWRMPS